MFFLKVIFSETFSKVKKTVNFCPVLFEIYRVLGVE
jgi:hypothetical protein